MIHVTKTFPAGSVVFAFTRCFHRHLDLCGMFDRHLCRKVVATYMLKRKGKIATHDVPLQCNVESTSLTTPCVTSRDLAWAWLSDVATQPSSFSNPLP